MDDLLREAIADAKAVRETALANAKIALEEAFTPRLQSMLSKKIATEMEDSEEEMDKEEEMDADEMRDSEEAMHDKEEAMHDKEEEMDADEMRDAEEMRNSDEEEMDEAEDAEEMRNSDEEEMDEAEDKEEDDKEEMREDEDTDEEDKVDEAEDAEETEDAEEDELDLESVLAELEKDLDDEDKVDEEYNTDEVGDGMDKDEVETDEDKLAENDVSSDIGSADNKVNPEANDSTKSGAQGPEGEGSDKPAGKELGDHEIVDDLTEVEDKDEEDLDLDEVLAALTEEEDAEEEDAKVDELQKEIKEYRKVINFMRQNLNEVNLLNAKLLFSNKLFRAFGLNNNQKLKVVETFDRTKNLREVKLVYATLAESFKRPSNISESVKKGSSSKPVRSTKPQKEVLSEGQELRNRFKKLANIL